MHSLKPVVVAVVGNPAVGKSTLYNAIAGGPLRMGSWSNGKVENKVATCVFAGRRIMFVELPGCYSLSPDSQQDIITRNHLLNHRPDVIVNVVEAGNLVRSLYLSIQLMELNVPLIMVLNVDEFAAKGYRIDALAMERVLGVTVIPTTAHRRKWVEDLFLRALAIAAEPEAHRPRQLKYDHDVECAVEILETAILQEQPTLARRYPLRWLAYKLLEEDRQVRTEVTLTNGALFAEVLHHLRRTHGEDIESFLAAARFDQACALTRTLLVKSEPRTVKISEMIRRFVQLQLRDRWSLIASSCWPPIIFQGRDTSCGDKKNMTLAGNPRQCTI